MRQRHSQSALEAATSVILGWVAALVTQAVIFPVMGLQMVLWQSLALTDGFTIVSFLGGHALRRYLVRWSEEGAAPGCRNASGAPPPRRFEPK